jgi:hypothetical protein
VLEIQSILFSIFFLLPTFNPQIKLKGTRPYPNPGMICCVKDCIDLATSNIIHHHHHEYDKKCDTDRGDENHCVLTICQRHRIQLTEKQRSVILRHRTPRSTAVAMYYCDYPKGHRHII